MASFRPRSIALINPLADYGIDTYTYELGQGLAANGVSVDAYCSAVSRIGTPELDPRHRRFNVLGGRLPRNLDVSTPVTPARPTESKRSTSDGSVPRAQPGWRRRLRQVYLSGELALRLKAGRYDAVWTQWPEMEDYADFWNALRWLGNPLVHTVHNVLPHQRSPGDVALYGAVYDAARVLFVHSRPVRDELAALFPRAVAKAFAIPHGTYTFYKRQPAARARLRAELNIPAASVALLFCGAIRPYKNIDAAIAALAALGRDDVVLIVAGSEGGDGLADPLARTKQLVRDAGVEHRVRLMPGYLDAVPMAELFEAADVLLLPYLKSYGSGLLMLGITFGKYIVATRSGMEESASRYPRAIIVDGDDAAAVEQGIELAIERVRSDSAPLHTALPEFEWSNIAAASLNEIGRVLSGRAAAAT
jgi:glycosyltransferase involved in cell wall biosynthesis